MTATINSLPPIPSLIELSFSFSPAGTYTFVKPDLSTIVSPSAASGTALTFTAVARIDNQGDDLTGPLSIVEYRWDFGDGTLAYSNPVTHTYKLANFQARTALRVTDSKGRHWFTRAQMYLS